MNRTDDRSRATSMIHLTQKDTTVEQSRFYRLEIIPSLLGHWGVQHKWGVAGKRRSLKVDWCNSRAEAETKASQLAERKLNAWCKESGLLNRKRNRQTPGVKSEN